jgi:hypothetical protein
MAIEIMECVHGLIFQTCKLCKDKSVDEIHAEIISFGDGSKKEKVKVEYQEVINPELDADAVDNAYDFEESSDY